MSLKTSTGLRNKLLDTNSLDAIMANGFIKIYAGDMPATADEAVPGGATLLCTISVNSGGGGINFDAAAANGALPKAPGEVWSGVNAATGTAAWFRHVAPGDDGTLSTSQPRLQGSVGTVAAELNLSSVALVSGATQTIDYYSVALPTL